jgi:hypothetical protein
MNRLYARHKRMILARARSPLCRSQWPRGLRRGSAAARLLGLWVSNPNGGMDVCLLWVVCCQVEVSATSWSLVQRSPTDSGGSQMCMIMKPRRNEEAQAHIRLSSHKKKVSTLPSQCGKSGLFGRWQMSVLTYQKLLLRLSQHYGLQRARFMQILQNRRISHALIFLWLFYLGAE